MDVFDDREQVVGYGLLHRAVDEAARRGLADRFAGRVRLLAEKVETRAEQALALQLGYDLLQGHFLQEPVTMSRRCADVNRQLLVPTLFRAPACASDSRHCYRPPSRCSRRS